MGYCCFVRRENLPEGEVRVALTVSDAQNWFGKGYYELATSTWGHRLPRLAFEHNDLFNPLFSKIRQAMAAQMRRMYRWIIFLFVPSFVILAIGLATGGFEENALLAISFLLANILPIILVVGPCKLRRFREWQQERDEKIQLAVNESAPEWESQTPYTLTYEVDNRAPKLQYLCFRLKDGVEGSVTDGEVNEEETEIEIV